MNFWYVHITRPFTVANVDVSLSLSLSSSWHCWEFKIWKFLATFLLRQAISLFWKILTICLIPTNDYFIVRELSVNSWNLTKGGKSVGLSDSLSCRQSRPWTKLSCSYLCCELRDPSQVTLAWQTIHTNSPNNRFFMGPMKSFLYF